MSRSRIAFLVHSQVDLPGLLEVRARQLDLAVSVHRVHAGPEQLPSRGSFEALVVMGSARSVNDESVSWLPGERRVLEGAVKGGIPVLGVCFGGQLLAQVLGGRVTPGRRPEIGWLGLRSSRPSLVGPGPWLAWHQEVFEPPPGSSLLARTDLAPHAFTLGPHLGIQFHPEITPQLLALWIERSSSRGVLSAGQAAELTAGADRHAGEAGRQARRLFDGFLGRAGLREAPARHSLEPEVGHGS